MLIDSQILCKTPKKFKRMELCLCPIPYRPLGRNGQGQLVGKFGISSDALQGVEFLFDFSFGIGGINIVVGDFKIARDLFCQRFVALCRRTLGIILQAGGVPVKLTDQLIVDQSVTDGDFCRRSKRHPLQYAVLFDQYIVYISLLQFSRAQYARNSPANDQHVCACIL